MIAAVLVALALSEGPTVPLVGMVVGPDGAPVAGAEIVLTGPKPAESPVVARGRSDANGRFRLDRPAGLAPMDRFVAPTLWVVASGHRVAPVKFAEAVPGPDQPVRVVLKPAARTEIRVKSPEGAPVAGARVSVLRLLSEPMPVPDPVYQLTERTTGPDGLAVLDSVGLDDLVGVDVVAEGFGTQPRWFDPGAPGPRVVTLRPVATLKGRLVPDEGIDPEVVRGWRIRAWTTGPENAPLTVTSAGYSEATTDDRGRFDLREIAPGFLRLNVIPPGKSNLLPDLREIKAVRGGRENAIEVPLRRPSTVTGLVLERGTGAPVAGVEFILTALQGAPSGERALSDDQGRFTLRSLPGKVRIGQARMPPTHLAAPGIGWEDFDVPAKPTTIELKPREVLRAAPPIRGLVRDELGKPVAGAEVTANWTLKTPRGNWGHSTRATSDNHGGFVLNELAPGAQVTINARYRDRATAVPVKVAVGSGQPVIVAIEPRPVVAVAGRVLGPGGVPIVGAVVRINFRETAPGRLNFGRRVEFQGQPTMIRSDPDGNFRTPRELDRDGREYQAEIDTPGYQSARTPWMAPGDGEILSLPDLVLRRLQTIRSVTGRVVDVQGHPVAGARVFQAGDGPAPTEAATDEPGRFRLDGVYNGRALVFAEKAGFRFGGAIVGPDAGAVEVRLARVGGPPIAVLKTLPSPLSRDQERALGRALIEPVYAEASGGFLGHVGESAIPTMARLDPNRVRLMLDDRFRKLPAGARVNVALAQFEGNPAAAVATINAEHDPSRRALGFLALADAVPAEDEARRAEFLGRALDEARRAKEPGATLSLFHEIAGRMLARGDLDGARPILQEGKAIIGGLPKQGLIAWSEEFAETLAVIDLPAARAIFEYQGRIGVGQPNQASVRRHLGEAAIQIAAFDPATSEQLAAEGSGGPNPGDHDLLLVRIARRMGHADLPRARKLLQPIAEREEDPAFARRALVPYALGLIAADRAATDPAGARALFVEAFDGLARLAREKDGRTRPSASIALAALLPAVERADPDRLAERLWLAASCRPPRPQEPSAWDVTFNATLAMLVSRFDRDLADVLAAPALERLPALLGPSGGWSPIDGRTYNLLATYDPRCLDPLIRALPASASARKTRRQQDGNLNVAPEAVARLAAAEMLGLPVAERRRSALERAGDLFKMTPDRP